MKKGLVSIIVPVYNRADLVDRCVNDLLRQTHAKVEIVIVDDGSSDHPDKVISRINDSRIKFISYSPNRGACYARNYGADHSEGEYIAFQDSDDTWCEDKIEKQLRYLEQNGCDMVFCGMERVDKSKSERFYYPRGKVNTKNNFHRSLLCGNCISTQTMLMKRFVFENTRFDPEIKRFQDWDFAIRASKKYDIGYISEALVYSEIQSNSITSMNSAINGLNAIYKKYEDEIIVDNYIYSKFMEKIGDAEYRNTPKAGLPWYIKSMKKRFSGKVFAKSIFSILGIRR